MQLRAGEEIEGAFLFVGDKSTNNGMDNKACAIVSGAQGTSSGHQLSRKQLEAAEPLAVLDASACRAIRDAAVTQQSQPHPASLQNVDLPSGKAVEVTCEAEGKYVTLATPKDLVLCDIYVTGEVRDAVDHALPCKLGPRLLTMCCSPSAALPPPGLQSMQLCSRAPSKCCAPDRRPCNPTCPQAMASDDSQEQEQDSSSSSNPSYSTGAGEYSGNGDQSSGNVPSAPSGDNPEDNPLLDQLLSTQEQGGSDFHTTSAEVRWFDCSIARWDGTRPIGGPTCPSMSNHNGCAQCQQAATA